MSRWDTPVGGFMSVAQSLSSPSLILSDSSFCALTLVDGRRVCTRHPDCGLYPKETP